MQAEPAHTPPDGSLVAQAQTGDTRAFETLYRRHAGRVRAICLRMSGDPIAADDLVQSTFVSAWRHLKRFRGQATLTTWLHRIAVNHVLQHQRSAGRRQARVIPLHAPERRTQAPEGRLLDLERAVEHLPPRARMVFVLHDVEGYHHPEVADMLGVTVGTSKAQLHRARRLLREELDR